SFEDLIKITLLLPMNGKIQCVDVAFTCQFCLTKSVLNTAKGVVRHSKLYGKNVPEAAVDDVSAVRSQVVDIRHLIYYKCNINWKVYHP
ncbi:MAG: hypothetical protein ACI8XG_001786, partial [Congregibacter sp.]